MNQDFQAIKILDKSAALEVRANKSIGPRYKVVTQKDRWLSAAYSLLEETFDRDVLDPMERYEEWIEMNQNGRHKFPYIMMVSYVLVDETAYIVGVISGNIMKVDRRDGAGNNSYIFAIGHQCTSKLLRDIGYKGIGAQLWEATTKYVSEEIDKLSGIFEFSMLEAETDSLGYWAKLGYLWPKGVIYWQPPLEFDESGNYISPEVPEMLMLRAIDPAPGKRIDRMFLVDMIRTVYENWSLDKYRKILTSEALKRAEDYVMGTVFNRFCERLPNSQFIDLVPIVIGNTARGKDSYRSMALDQGSRHGLEPLASPNLDKIGSFSEMLLAMKGTAFGGRNLGDAADVLFKMAADRDCKIVVTLSGAVSIAKMDMIIAEMIERNLVHCIITTGAIICHGFNAERGSNHFKLGSHHSDLWLFRHGYNRIFDTIETEYALDELEDIVHAILSKQSTKQAMGSCILMELLGEYLVAKGSSTGMIQSAVKRKVPIFIPAFTDSEIGIDFATFNYYNRLSNKEEITYNPFIDFERYCDFTKANPTRGILTLGGGVPRNWAQQIGPYLDALERRQKGIALNPAQFKYGVRICPDPPYLGGLSGSTYSEGTSWGKFVPTEEGGQFAEVYADFSLVFPLLIKGLFERLEAGK